MKFTYTITRRLLHLYFYFLILYFLHVYIFSHWVLNFYITLLWREINIKVWSSNKRFVSDKMKWCTIFFVLHVWHNGPFFKIHEWVNFVWFILILEINCTCLERELNVNLFSRKLYVIINKRGTFIVTIILSNCFFLSGKFHI